MIFFDNGGEHALERLAFGSCAKPMFNYAVACTYYAKLRSCSDMQPHKPNLMKRSETLSHRETCSTNLQDNTSDVFNQNTDQPHFSIHFSPYSDIHFSIGYNHWKAQKTLPGLVTTLVKPLFSRRSVLWKGPYCFCQHSKNSKTLLWSDNQ